MKSEILTALRNTKEYVSGQELCEKLGVSRTAVWKGMKKLKEEGYQIEAIPNKGYRLMESPDVLNAEELESIRKTAWAGKQIVYYHVTDSTNIQAKRLAEEGFPWYAGGCGTPGIRQGQKGAFLGISGTCRCFYDDFAAS